MLGALLEEAEMDMRCALRLEAPEGKAGRALRAQLDALVEEAQEAREACLPQPRSPPRPNAPSTAQCATARRRCERIHLRFTAHHCRAARFVFLQPISTHAQAFYMRGRDLARSQLAALSAGVGAGARPGCFFFGLAEASLAAW